MFDLRPFQPSDLDALLEAELGLVLRQDYADVDPEIVRERWRTYLEDGLGLAGTLREGMRVDVLVDDEGAYAGHVLLLEQVEPGSGVRQLIVGMIVVRDDLRGRGLGTRLLRHAEEVARARGIVQLSLGVHPDNPARRLYERFGYEPHRVIMTRVLAEP